MAELDSFGFGSNSKRFLGGRVAFSQNGLVSNPGIKAFWLERPTTSQRQR